MPRVYIDADACPVKEEAERVATRHGVRMLMVSNGGIRPSANPLVESVFVSAGPDEAEQLLARPHTDPFVMRGREMTGWLRVLPEGLSTDAELDQWVEVGLAFARSLPPK